MIDEIIKLIKENQFFVICMIIVFVLYCNKIKNTEKFVSKRKGGSVDSSKLNLKANRKSVVQNVNCEKNENKTDCDNYSEVKDFSCEWSDSTSKCNKLKICDNNDDCDEDLKCASKREFVCLLSNGQEHTINFKRKGKCVECHANNDCGNKDGKKQICNDNKCVNFTDQCREDDDCESLNNSQYEYYCHKNNNSLKNNCIGKCKPVTAVKIYKDLLAIKNSLHP
jgi:hypothetical protein